MPNCASCGDGPFVKKPPKLYCNVATCKSRGSGEDISGPYYVYEHQEASGALQTYYHCTKCRPRKQHGDLLLIETAGGGRVRFHSDLFAHKAYSLLHDRLVRCCHCSRAVHRGCSNDVPGQVRGQRALHRTYARLV
jgi:hypothetical protein